MKEEKEEEKARQVWICTFCGSPYESKKEAEQCWNSHSELTIEYIWGGIGSGTDMPLECLIKKIERGYVTEIATYERKSIKKVKMKMRRIEEKKD